MQRRLTRNILGVWPKQGEDWQAYARKTARWAESLWRDPSLGRSAGQLMAAMGGTFGGVGRGVWRDSTLTPEGLFTVAEWQ